MTLGSLNRASLEQHVEPRDCRQPILAVLAFAKVLVNRQVERRRTEGVVVFEAFGRDVYGIGHDRDRTLHEESSGPIR